MKIPSTFITLWTRVGALAISLSLPTMAYAAEGDPVTCSGSTIAPEDKLECLFPTEETLIKGSPQGQSSSGTTSLPHGDIITDFLPFFINTLLGIAGTLIFIAFLYAGYQMVFANDNEESINSAKKVITYAIIGAFVIAISYAVVYGVANLNLD